MGIKKIVVNSLLVDMIVSVEHVLVVLVRIVKQEVQEVRSFVNI